MSVMIDALLYGWEKNRDYGQRLLRDVRPERITFQPAFGTNHPAWTLSHLNLYHPVLVALLRQQPFEDTKAHRYGMQSKPLPDLAEYPSKDDLLAAWEQGHQDVAHTLREVGAPVLDLPTPLERWKPVMPKVGMVLSYLMHVHEATHLGQLSAWRRVQGMPAV